MAFRPKIAPRWTWIALGIVIVLMAGCIRIPEESWIISHRSPLESKAQAADCTAACLNQAVPDQGEPNPVVPPQTIEVPELNSAGFSLVSWNIYKNKEKGWKEDFEKLSRNTDILILQEVYLSTSLKDMLQQEAYQWDMTTAFEYRQIEAGVLTASKTAPNFTCTFRETEPIIRIPKSVLITRYSMSGTDRELLVAPNRLKSSSRG